MSKLWIDRDTGDLILNYNGILWGLKEEIHCRVRVFDGVSYAIPEICTTEFFTEHIKPGMLRAKESIENILCKRGITEIPTTEFKIIASEEADLRDVGWETYKAIKQFGLEFGEQRTT
jgi:hypothetical protein